MYYISRLKFVALGRTYSPNRRDQGSTETTIVGDFNHQDASGYPQPRLVNGDHRSIPNMYPNKKNQKQQTPLNWCFNPSRIDSLQFRTKEKTLSTEPFKIPNLKFLVTILPVSRFNITNQLGYLPRPFSTISTP